MKPITREQLKREIDILDAAYLDLVYRVLKQFPHATPYRDRNNRGSKAQSDKPSFSQCWRGKLGSRQFSPETWEAEPRLAYLVDRYKL